MSIRNKPISTGIQWCIVLQKGVIAFPKSVRIDCGRFNPDILDSELSKEEIYFLDGLENGKRSGPDSGNFNF